MFLKNVKFPDHYLINFNLLGIEILHFLTIKKGGTLFSLDCKSNNLKDVAAPTRFD